MLTTCKREDMCSPAILTSVFMCLRRTPGTRFAITDGSDRRPLPELAGFSPHISDRRLLPELTGFSPHISDFHPMPELAGFSHRGRRYRWVFFFFDRWFRQKLLVIV
ncbi:hypothetical protein Bca101_037124 [Brassica carinata]